MWIDDLAPYADSAKCVAVGWLERGRVYAVGEAPPEVFTKLEILLTDPRQPAAAGVHPCDLCAFRPEVLGANNVFIPGEDRVYVAPERVLHYMNAHRYRPPMRFVVPSWIAPRCGPRIPPSTVTAGGPGLLRGVGEAAAAEPAIAADGASPRR